MDSLIIQESEFNIENCSILRKHLKYTALKQTCFSIYTGKNDFTISFKWLKNNKPEGEKPISNLIMEMLMFYLWITQMIIL